MRVKNEQYFHGLVDMLEQSGDMHMITDRAGVIEYVNPAFESVTGFGKAEVIGLTPLMLESGLPPDCFYSAMWETLKAGKAFTEKTFKGMRINRKRNGEIFHEETTISPIHDALGNITHYFATGRDVTKNARELDQ